MQRSAGAESVRNLGDTRQEFLANRQWSACGIANCAVSRADFSDVNPKGVDFSPPRDRAASGRAPSRARVEFACQPKEIQGLRPVLFGGLWKI